MKIKIHLVPLILVVVLAILTVPAMAAPSDIVIDGNLSDWGLDWYNGLNEDNTVTSTQEQCWVPDSSTCTYVVEDNRLVGTSSKTDPVWSSYSTRYGVHITGTGSTYDTYNEPQISGYVQPSGGEIFDIEALYFDSDPTTIYVAIITSCPENGMGDLNITIGGTTYAVILNGNSTKGRIIANPTWIKTGQKPTGWPYLGSPLSTSANYRATGAVIGQADFAYNDSGHSDNVHTYYDKDYSRNHRSITSGPNWIIEIGIPRSMLDDPTDADLANLCLTVWCYNEEISLVNAAPVPTPEPTPGPQESTIPEFTTIALPALSIVGMYVFFSYRKKKQ